MFDNHNTSRREDGDHPASRILVKDVSTNLTTIPYQGTKQQLFFTNIMGKHQWLDNGNLLISESRLGRALEVDRNGEIVWEMYNVVEPGWLGIMEEVERLPPEMNGEFFGRARQQCEAS